MRQASLAKGLKARAFVVACIVALLLCAAPVAYADDEAVSGDETTTVQSVEALQPEPESTDVVVESVSDNVAECVEPSAMETIELTPLVSSEDPSSDSQPPAIETSTDIQDVPSARGDSSGGDAEQPCVNSRDDAVQLCDGSAECAQSSKPAPADSELPDSVASNVVAEPAVSSATAKVVVVEDSRLDPAEPVAGQVAGEVADKVEVPETKPTYAYAVFDPIGNSLVFNRGVYRPLLRSSYFSLMFTGFEDEAYEAAADVPWAHLSSRVASVVFNDTIAPSSTAYWFASCSRLESFDACGYLDTSRVTSMRGMFSNCSKLSSVSMVGWDTSSLTDVSGLFDGCESVKKVDGFDQVMVSLSSKGASVSGFDTLGNFAVGQLGMSKDTFASGDDDTGEGPSDNGDVPVTVPQDGTELVQEPVQEFPSTVPGAAPEALDEQQSVSAIVGGGDTASVAGGAQTAALPSAPSAAEAKPASAPALAPSQTAVRPSARVDNGVRAVAPGVTIYDDGVPMSAFGMGTGPIGGVLDAQVDDGSALASARSLLQSIADGSHSSQLRMGVSSVLFDLLNPENPYAIFIAGISLVAAACFMITFCLNLH